MRNRFICLTLSMLMLLTVLLTGCNKEKDTADVEQISGITLTMWVITDKEVANTDAEMAALKAKLKAKYGEGAAYEQAVAEAEATRAAYDKVEAEITKITKLSLSTISSNKKVASYPISPARARIAFLFKSSSLSSLSIGQAKC